MDDRVMLQKVLDAIDARITEPVALRALAGEFSYSAYHFSRLFARAARQTLMAYVTRRKLRYALYDLACGEKILDVAVKYGFQTHAGFTKAFKKYYGCPPSLYRIHAIASRPARMEYNDLINQGGLLMPQEIVKLESTDVVGFTSRHKMPDVRHTRDIPLWWETVNLDYAAPLTRLHDLFNRSRHTEYAVCFDADPAAGEFTYLLGVGVDSAAELKKKEPDMYAMRLPGGLYARFTTPWVKNEALGQSVRNLWEHILGEWLPGSGYAYDEKRYDFEFYDERDHPWLHNGLAQMDICFPVQPR